jgi:poly-gamma-glutamate capsule biosynthesis protein CapA/YwtB (metallophosphatase superfamily)
MGARALLAVGAVAALACAGPAGAALAVAEGESPVGAEPVRRLTILASGDLLVHSQIYRRADALRADGYDFRPFFARIRPLVRRADLAVCHAETPIGAGPPSSYPLFNSPRALARAIAWTGWDACTVASNHSVDRGQGGVRTTLRALERAGVRHAGTARSSRESRRTTFLEARGIRVALLSYTYGTNGIPLPHRWSVNLISTRRVVADARRARRRGADLVLANFHWGSEYVHAPNAQQRSLARFLLRRGIVDAIVGQHAHVVQPIARVGGRFVVYGEGNLISAQDGESRDGLMALLHVRAEAGRAEVARVEYAPIWVEPGTYVVQPAARRLRALLRRGLGDSALARELLASHRRTVGHAGSSRRIRPVPLPRSYR